MWRHPVERYFRTVGATAQPDPGGDPGDDGRAMRAYDLETLNVTIVQVRYNAMFVPAFVTVDALTFVSSCRTTPYVCAPGLEHQDRKQRRGE